LCICLLISLLLYWNCYFERITHTACNIEANLFAVYLRRYMQFLLQHAVYNMRLPYFVRCYSSDVRGIYVSYLQRNIAIGRDYALTLPYCFDGRMYIALLCICSRSRDSLVLGIILGYLSPNIDTRFWGTLYIH